MIRAQEFLSLIIYPRVYAISVPSELGIELLRSAFTEFPTHSALKELRIAMIETPTSANIASHIFAIPNAASMSTTIFTINAKAMF